MPTLPPPFDKIPVTDRPEDCDACICVTADTPTPFSDNLLGACHECGVRVQFRPYVPVSLPKLCIPCAHRVLVKEDPHA